MKHLAVVGLAVLCALAPADSSGGQRLAIRVSPAVALAPASLSVRATIEPNDDNRTLTVVVDSPTYRRSSEISLDGRASERVTVIELHDVPPGLYEVRAKLLGPSGELASAMQLVKVQPSPGHDR